MAGSLLLAGSALALTTSAAHAADFYLVARGFDATLPDGAVVPMWGFAECDATFTSCGPTTSPGPTLRVPPGEPSPVVLNLHVRNELAVPTSAYIPDQLAALSPVKFTDAMGRARVRSLTAETPAGGDGLYTWPDLRPGTYLYHSGTHPQVQVQMGLLGVLVYDAAPGVAYPGVPYDAEALLVYSEIDPALHAAVADGTYGTPAYPSTFDYKPTYFLVNGAPYTPGTPPLSVGEPGDRVLLRLVNAALGHRAPQLLGGYLSLVAEEGHPLAFPGERYGTFLGAGTTQDAIFVAGAEGVYPIYDRMGSLTTNNVSGGGSYAFLSVAHNALVNVTPAPLSGSPAAGRPSAPQQDLTPGTPDPAGLDAPADRGAFGCGAAETGGAGGLALMIALALGALVGVRRRGGWRRS
ncbi:MAG: hypothetical protein CVU56_22565 [Deltaproteobacteria bacterium HGW-Deltaproteobacteria-14]|nr:MAG: hypothetical protein CVU56_22565 [Deltaproteobacteria bacterium HGW-Deltaproteobacteria-14]